MTLKGDAKFKRKLICDLKKDIRNMINFHAKSQAWKFALWLDPFVQSIQIFRWKSTEELCLMTLKSDAKFEEKLTLGSKNDMRNLVNFNASSDKSGNLHFDVLLLSIAYKVSAWKVQKNYLSWHWKKIQTLKKNCLLFEKWHEEFGDF